MYSFPENKKKKGQVASLPHSSMNWCNFNLIFNPIKWHVHLGLIVEGRWDQARLHTTKHWETRQNAAYSLDVNCFYRVGRKQPFSHCLISEDPHSNGSGLEVRKVNPLKCFIQRYWAGLYVQFEEAKVTDLNWTQDCTQPYADLGPLENHRWHC